MIVSVPRSTLFPYTTLFRSAIFSVSWVLFSQPLAVADPDSLVAVTNRLTMPRGMRGMWRSEEHTSELQSHHDIVCRLLLEKKKHRTRVTRQTDRLQALNTVA